VESVLGDIAMRDSMAGYLVSLRMLNRAHEKRLPKLLEALCATMSKAHCLFVARALLDSAVFSKEGGKLKWLLGRSAIRGYAAGKMPLEAYDVALWMAGGMKDGAYNEASTPQLPVPDAGAPRWGQPGHELKEEISGKTPAYDMNEGDWVEVDTRGLYLGLRSLAKAGVDRYYGEELLKECMRVCRDDQLQSVGLSGLKALGSFSEELSGYCAQRAGGRAPKLMEALYGMVKAPATAAHSPKEAL
jgi:hypothetical protein